MPAHGQRHQQTAITITAVWSYLHPLLDGSERREQLLDELGQLCRLVQINPEA
jgi:hypothetical protein